jgi:glycosyltransferase involved in cell wall biosynthesis
MGTQQTRLKFGPARAGALVTEGKVAVCHIASGDLWAGAEVQTAILLRTLAQRDEFRLSAVLLNPGRLAEEVRSCGIEVKIIPESRRNFIAILSEATRYLKSQRIRILHSHRYKENVLAAALARLCRIPYVLRTQHGLPEPFVGFRNMKQQIIQRLDRFVARRATDRVISVSSEMTGRLGQRMDPRKIVTIPNGLEPTAVRSDLSVTEARDRLGIPRACRVLGTAGRLEPIKRLDLFLRAAKLISVERPDTRYVIAGGGREEPGLRALADSLGLGQQVLFLGHRNDIYDVLRALDVLILCSDHEGLPMVLLEALSLGVAVVARAVGGIPEVITHNAQGVLVDSASPIALAQACLGLLGDDARRDRLAKAGAGLVGEKFSAQMTAACVSQLYFSLSGGQ